MTRPLADPAPPEEAEPAWAATRRQVLLGGSALALVAAASTLAAAEPVLEERGEPFDDGTWFDDGYGWVD